MTLTKSDRKTESYIADDGFIVDIVTNWDESGRWFEAWLYHKQYGVKTLMFGGLESYHKKREFLEIVKANLPRYIPLYIEDYFD